MGTNGADESPLPKVLPVTGRMGRRRLPNAAEQERRKAWGAKWGTLVGESIKRAIREAE